MVSQIISCLSKSSSLLCISGSRSLILQKTYNRGGLNRFSPGLASRRLSTFTRRKWRSASIFNSGKESGGEGRVALSPTLPLQEGLAEIAALPYLGVDVEKLSLDQKAEILFLDQGITTAVILAVIFTVAKTFDPLPEDILRYDLKQPFNLQKGWLVWGGIGLVAAVGGIALTGVALSLFSTETPEREVDSLMQLLPLIGSSNISTLSLVGITGVLAPLLEETVFRGFFMVSLTKWVPTPIAIIISSAAFALAHLTPGEFPQLFILGSVLGLTYAQTRNLITPMVIHGLWNSGVILLLTFLQVQGYDIKELLQGS